MTSVTGRATIEHVFMQGSLFGCLEPAVDPDAGGWERVTLDASSWVDVAPGWMQGADRVFDELVDTLPWRQRRGVPMYDSLVDEPRLTCWWRLPAGRAAPLPVLDTVRAVLTRRYSCPFDSIGFNLYRSGRDSVAWHGDRHRHTVADPVVAIVSVGSRRQLRLRPRGGGPSQRWDLGHGDLFVMGGACQHEWEHCVPKSAAAVGPRLSITFRHGATRSIAGRPGRGDRAR